MKTPTSRGLTGIFLFVSLLFYFWTGNAVGKGKWVSHVDPSLISEIVLHDGEFYIASTGGLLIHRPGESSFEQFTNVIGLPSSFLTCLVFDSSGRMWVGTEDSGIARLDGVGSGFEVTPYSSMFHDLTDDRITDLAAWGDTLVYATKDGAGFIINDFPKLGFDQDNLPSRVVNAVLPDGDRLWMATDEGVVYADRFGFIWNPTDTLFGGFSLVRTDSAVWVGTATGVAYLKDGGNEWIHTEFVGDDHVRPVFSLAFDGEKLWAGARARFYENDGSGWTRHDIFGYYNESDLNNTKCEIRGLQPMPGGTVYLGGGDPIAERRGVYLVFFDGDKTSRIPFNGIPANALVRLTFDIDESLWVSTARFGVAKLTPSEKWFAYNRASGDTNLSSRWTNLAFLADTQGSKWFCTLSWPLEPVPLDELQDQLDTDYTNDVWDHYQIGDGGGDGLGSLRPQDAAEDPAGNRWFLCDEQQEHAPGWWGINILSGDKLDWKQVNPTTTDRGAQFEKMKSGNVTDVAFAEDGVVYVALRYYGVQRWVTGGFDKENLFDLSDDEWTTTAAIGDADGIDASAEIWSLVRRDDGVLWIGTDVGVYRYYRGQLKYVAPNRGFGPTGLLGNLVSDLLLDREENLWLATNLGLNRIARDDIHDIESFTTPVVWQTQLNLFFPLDVVSPLVNADCIRLALHPTRDVLYIATANGLSELDIPSLTEKGSGLSRVYVYPNPIRAVRGDREFMVGNIDSAVLVEIFTIEGELVHRQTDVGSGDSVWEGLTTKTGFKAASGVYLVRISGVEETVIKMVSLIR